MTNEQRVEYTQLPLRHLAISDSNVRRRETTAGIDNLADNLDELGLQQPIVVQRHGDRYEIIIGQRRFLAAKQLGWEEIDVKILPETLSELDAKVISFSENAHRRDLSPKDKAEVCSYLLRELGTVRAVAERIGVSEVTVRKWLGYAAVPEPIKRLVDEERITVPIATRIVQNVADEKRAIAIAERIAQENPPAEARGRILAAVEEYPHRPVEAIFQKAEEQRYQRQIVFVLPPRWSEVIEQAARELSRAPDDIAQEATIEWLSRFASVIPTQEEA